MQKYNAFSLQLKQNANAYPYPIAVSMEIKKISEKSPSKNVSTSIKTLV